MSPLTEAIALGHDLGHAFRTCGEYILNEICEDGFAHYKQSVRVGGDPGKRDRD